MDYEILWRIHAILMGTSFLSLLTGILISLIFKKRKWRYKTHKRLGIYAGISGVTALVIAFIMVQSSGGFHFTTPHTIIGAVTGLLLIATPLAGLRIRKAENKKRMKLIHRTMGYITCSMMLVTIVMGLFLVGILYLP